MGALIPVRYAHLPVANRKYLYNNIVLSMLYAEICPKVRRQNARPEESTILLLLLL